MPRTPTSRASAIILDASKSSSEAVAAGEPPEIAEVQRSRREKDRPLLQAIGANIRGARESAGLTQEELGREVGIVGNAIGNYERGDTDPPASTLVKIARACNSSIAFLVGERSLVNTRQNEAVQALMALPPDWRAPALALIAQLAALHESNQ